MKLLEVDDHGFDEVDRKLLRTIIDKFGGGPVGVNSLAAAISEERDAIEDIYEPFLIQAGFLDRTPRGRVATARAYEYFGLHGARERISSVVTPSRVWPARAHRAGRDISSLATYVPPRVLTNADLEKMVETSDEWILQRTGIRERHIVDPGVATSDLATEASLKAIARAGLTPDDIDFIIVGTTRPTCCFRAPPACCSTRSAPRTPGASTCRAACSAFTYALTTAAQMVAAGGGKHALVVGADVMSSIIDYTDRTTCVLFGDGAGAVVVEAARRRRRRHHRLRELRRRQRRRGAVHAGRRQPAAGVARDRRPAAALREAGRPGGVQVRRAQHRGSCASASSSATASPPHDIDLFVSHQANRRIIQAAADEARRRPSRRSSSTSSGSATPRPATIPLALNDAVETGRLKKGDLVLLASVGAGFTVGAVLLRWAY